MLASWRDKSVLLLTLAVLAVGSVVISLAPDILTLHGVRFIIGLAHGVFMAVASNAAVKLVDPMRAGRALSLVWIGLTLSIAFGVPIGTFFGSYWSWRIVFLAIGGLGLISTVGLVLLMRRQPTASPNAGRGLKQGLAALLHRELLMAATIAMLVSVATFSFFTFVLLGWILTNLLQAFRPLTLWAMPVLGIGLLVVLLPASMPAQVTDNEMPDQFVLEHLDELKQTTALLSNELESASALAWRLQRPEVGLYETEGELRYGLQYPDTVQRKISLDQVQGWLKDARQKGSVGVLVRAGSSSEMRQVGQLPPGGTRYDKGYLQLIIYPKLP